MVVLDIILYFSLKEIKRWQLIMNSLVSCQVFLHVLHVSKCMVKHKLLLGVQENTFPYRGAAEI